MKRNPTSTGAKSNDFVGFPAATPNLRMVFFHFGEGIVKETGFLVHAHILIHLVGLLY